MRKLLLILLPLLFVSCGFSGKFNHEYKNVSSYDVQLKINSSVYNLSIGQSITEEIGQSDTVSIKGNDRVEIAFKYSGYSEIIDKYYSSITVFNSSGYDILLYEKNNYIGTQEEVLQAKANKEKIKVEVPAGSTATFVLYTIYPEYEAYFKDNNMPADIALLSFVKN